MVCQGQLLTRMFPTLLRLSKPVGTAQYHTLHGQYGGYGDVYNQEFDYTPSTAEEDAIRDSVKVWTEEELLYAVGAGLLKPVSDTTISVEDPNIIGTSVNLITHSGGVGNTDGYQDIVLSSPLSLTEDQRTAFAAAERDDLAYMGPSVAVTVNFTGGSNTITRSSGSWVADGFVTGMHLEISGSSFNDTAGGELYKVANVTSSTLTLTSEAGLNSETSAAVTIFPEVLTPSVTTVVDFSAAGNTITRIAGSWIDDGFSSVDKIRVTGVSDNASGPGLYYDVASVTATTLTLTGASFIDETGANVTVTPELAKIIINQREDVDVETAGEVNVTSDTNVYLGSEVDLNLDTIDAGTNIRIKSGGSIRNADGSSATNIIGGNLILEAAGGSIGGATAATKLYTDLFPTATITAIAQDDIYIVERNGNMNVETMYAQTGGVYLETLNGDIVDALNNEFTNLAANEVVFRSAGDIGESGDYLDIDVAASGTLTAYADESIWIRETLGDMNVNHVQSNTGDVDLRANLYIKDDNNVPVSRNSRQ